jgi:hypothetical protein
MDANNLYAILLVWMAYVIATIVCFLENNDIKK